MAAKFKTADRFQPRGTPPMNVMRQRPRCDCGGIIRSANCTCSTCGKVSIVPDDGESDD